MKIRKMMNRIAKKLDVERIEVKKNKNITGIISILNTTLLVREKKQKEKIKQIK